MRTKISVENVKLGDKLFVTQISGYGRDRAYYKGEVTHVTKTRFTVSFGSERQMMFNKKDGEQYPRPTGYGRADYYLDNMTPEANQLLLKQKLAIKARQLVIEINKIFTNANYREKIVSQELDEDEMEDNILLLEKTLKAFKKYGPKGADNE